MNRGNRLGNWRWWVLAATGLLAACASDGSKSASGTDVSTDALNQARLQVQQEGIPPELQAYYIELYSEGRQNSVLHAMQGGLAAVHRQRFDLATSLWDRAISEVEALQEGTRQAERAQSKFVGEQEKWFKGEPYERSALYFYRGLLYLQANDFDNAAACFKRTEIQDITADDKKDFAGDWYSAEWALALASLKAGRPDDAAAALRRASAFQSKQGSVPDPTAAIQRLVVVESGPGVQKYRAGRYGEKLKFYIDPARVRRVEIVQNGEVLAGSAPAESLFFQATTRGGRQVDAILADKAEFKEDTGNAAVALGAAAVGAAGADRSGIAAGILGLAAIGTAIVSGTSQPQADIRTWDNLPGLIYLIGLPAGTDATSLTVRGLDEQGEVVKTVEVPASTNPNKTLEVSWVRL